MFEYSKDDFDALFERLAGPARGEDLHAHRCDDCGNSTEWGRAARKPKGSATVPVSQPVTERRVTLCIRTGLRNPYRAAQGMVSCDHHHPGLDQAAVRRMLRSIGPEFGPEPPAGGSLARV